MCRVCVLIVLIETNSRAAISPSDRSVASSRSTATSDAVSASGRS